MIERSAPRFDDVPGVSNGAVQMHRKGTQPELCRGSLASSATPTGSTGCVFPCIRPANFLNCQRPVSPR